MRIRLDHVTISVSDLAASERFYDNALLPLGLSKVVEYVDPEDEDEAGVEAVGYGDGEDSTETARVRLWLVPAIDATSGVHIALQADATDDVDRFFEAAVTAGGTARITPRPWQIYRPGVYSAMVVDLDGNVIEAFAGS